MGIKIEQGIIYDGSKKVGTANRDFKYGYHPAVLVEVGKDYRWFEMDEDNLVAKIADFAREKIR